MLAARTGLERQVAGDHAHDQKQYDGGNHAAELDADREVVDPLRPRSRVRDQQRLLATPSVPPR